MRNLEGAEFKVVQVELDSNGQYVEVAVVPSEKIDNEGDGLFLFKDLKRHEVYALYETKAPFGYEQNTDPYYFVLQDSAYDMSKVPSGIKVHRFTDKSTIW